MEQNEYLLGIDVGSTTVKTVVTRDETILYTNYKRHFSKVRDCLLSQLKEIGELLPEAQFRVAVTGSAGLGLATNSKLPFVQEVQAAFLAVKKYYPDADAVIELGGEDAKIIFLTHGTEQRMNGSCAGGTGAFIDQMATLLQLTPKEMDEISFQAEKIYPIASRCGVFAKSDIQPLLNQGARREDIAASIFQAVVDQTVSGLAQGRRIEGKVLFLGGPLSFLKGLQKAFTETLKLDSEHAIFPAYATCFMAIGCTLYAEQSPDSMTLSELEGRLLSAKLDDHIVKGRVLFSSRAEYEQFLERHNSYDLPRRALSDYRGKAYLGIDAGSTTTKIVLLSENCELLYHHYVANKGQPLDCVCAQLKEIYDACGEGLEIVGSAVTGYGEDLMRAALKVDYGLVETVAHFKAASYFCPDVDFIIDIGGQDIKCFKIKNHSIDSIMLNEACSSGCGSFIQTFAQALGMNIEEFASLGLFAENPVELGSRCTVFMNSSVKQAQKEGATVEDISAGLSASIIKNAIYKVIRTNSPEDLGKHIVVQGGTFLNDAVLRSFELEIGRNVVRPKISELMGAFGAALYAKELGGKGELLTAEQLKDFSYRTSATTCKGCTGKCNLTIVRFSDGRKLISGNKCERGAGLPLREDGLDLYEFKYQLLLQKVRPNPEAKLRVGLPLCLNFYEQLPLWAEFFTRLNCQVVLSDESNREIYFKGQHTVASDTVCYPAKIAHGHIQSLLEKKVDFIFYPCESYNLDEKNSDNYYNCPIVAYYPELLRANNKALTPENFIAPYLDLNRFEVLVKQLKKALSAYHFKRDEIRDALAMGFQCQEQFHTEICQRALEIIRLSREQNRKIIVLAGRPYHVDPEINHGIHKLIHSLGMSVITEDSVFEMGKLPKLSVLNQWTYHSRLYRAAEYVTHQDDMQLVQLVSFGCGIDAITTDEVRAILESGGKLYTQLKIDEISNLGAVKIRLRSLLAAMEDKRG